MNQTNILLTALQRRSAIQVFDETLSVSEEDLRTIEQAFNLTATSYNLQPIRMVVLTRKQIVDNNLIRYCYGQKQVEQASHVLVICTEWIDKNFIEKHIDNINSKINTPLGHLLKLKSRLLELFVERANRQNFNTTFATNQAYIAVGNLITSLAILGIDACPMEGFDIVQLSNALELHQFGLKPVVIMPIGYRSSDDTSRLHKKIRRPLSESILRLNRF